MNNTGQALPISKSRFEVAYNILIKIFKEKTSLKIAKNSHEVGFLQLSYSEKAKCNDLVLKALKNLISIDDWIKKNKKSRLRVELICILRLIVAEIFTRSGRKSEVLRNFSVLAEKNKKTINSKDYIRYFIHKSYKDFSEKNFYPHCELEPIFRKKLLDQYSELEIKEMENIFSSNTSLDIVLKQNLNINDFFQRKAFVELHPSCIRLSKNESIIKMKGFLEGQWWIQNFSATLPVALLTENLEDKNVLDICCAPGGKTFQLLDRGAKVTSIDKSPSRINIMKENLNRLGFNVKLICEDVFKYKPEKKFDYILLDPPCTSTGTLGKNPDLQFLDPLGRLKNLLKLQEGLLQLSSNWLSKGGMIIYSVCSLLREEGEEQTLKFLKESKNFIQLIPKIEGFKLKTCHIDQQGGIRIYPQDHTKNGGVDGFYIAYLRLKEKNKNGNNP